MKPLLHTRKQGPGRLSELLETRLQQSFAFWNLVESACSDDDKSGDAGSGTCWPGETLHAAAGLP